MARKYCKKCGKVWYGEETSCPGCGSSDVKLSGSSYGGSGIISN